MVIKMNHSVKRQKLKSRLLGLVFAGCMGILAACGESERVDPVKEWVYVPEFISVGEEYASLNNSSEMQYRGDGLYYISHEWDDETGAAKMSMCKYSLTDKTVTKVPLDWGSEGKSNRSLNNTVFMEDGSMYATSSTHTYDEATQTSTSSQGLVKFGPDGKLVFFQDVTEKLKGASQSDYVYINAFAVDGKGRIYMAADTNIWLFESDGTYKGSLTVGSGMDSYLRAMGTGMDGKVYAVNYSYSTDGSSTELVEIDFDNAKTGASYKDFPRGNEETLTPSAEDAFIVNDGNSVCEYSLATQSKTELFDWLDSDINGEYVGSMGVLEDGRILALINDWSNQENSGIAILTKTKGSEVAQKETILIGVMGRGSELKEAAVKFNRGSDKYRISIKEYMDYDNYSDTSYQDAITRLNNDLTSKSSCPDILDLSGLNIKQLASKGLLEDLGEYLDKSSALKREDFLENILNAFTYDGVLTCIPTGFELSTLVGKSSDVGEEPGWTLEELIAYAQKHPGAELLDHSSKSTIMYYLMAYNEDSFIDWTKGECKFDTDEFKSLLTFANSFPGDEEVEYSEVSTPVRIQRGEVLLQAAYIYDFREIQMYYEIFGGDITCKGFPSADGSSGTALSAYGMYAITTKASHKEGAWEFLEGFLQEENDRYSFGFPTKKAKLDEMVQEAVTVQYYKDENGQLVMDENGNPIEIGVGGSIGYGDWSYEYRRPTQEEVDLVLKLMDTAKPITSSNTEILNIINEEAAAFFAGQKSVDEVAKIIQSRVKVYVDTNS